MRFPPKRRLRSRYSGFHSSGDIISGFCPHICLALAIHLFIRTQNAVILAHWELEKQLIQELLASTPENRAKTFERCYARLYSELDWLNRLVGQGDNTLPRKRYAAWLDAIGSPPLSIYEIGSGKGELIGYLARCGFQCKGTEITLERGEKLQTPDPNLSWGTSDGVHLDQFERTGTFDVAISNQVVEHLHPADLGAHLKSVCAILTPHGKYVLCTPHCLTGPHDVSVVFGLDHPEGMHLKEYTYRELVAAARNAGFRSVHVGIPSKGRRVLSLLDVNRRNWTAATGTLYLCLLLLVERVLLILPGCRLRRLSARALNRVRLFNGNIFLAIQK